MTWRPLKFKNIEKLQEKIDKYFEETPQEEWTITWLALALDTSRDTLMNYEWRDGFSDTIKRAKDMVEHSYEIDLKKKGNTGTIFALKNFDWKDKSEVDKNVKVQDYTFTTNLEEDDWDNNEHKDNRESWDK